MLQRRFLAFLIKLCSSSSLKTNGVDLNYFPPTPPQKRVSFCNFRQTLSNIEYPMYCFISLTLILCIVSADLELGLTPTINIDASTNTESVSTLLRSPSCLKRLIRSESSSALFTRRRNNAWTRIVVSRTTREELFHSEEQYNILHCNKKNNSREEVKQPEMVSP